MNPENNLEMKKMFSFSPDLNLKQCLLCQCEPGELLPYSSSLDLHDYTRTAEMCAGPQ